MFELALLALSKITIGEGTAIVLLLVVLLRQGRR